MSDREFQFECNDIFAIVGHGLVFRGEVLSGEASVGDRVRVLGSEGSVSGTIRLIEKDKKPISSTLKGAEIGLLLTEFSDARLDEMLAPRGDLESYPPQETYREMLGVSYPVQLVKI